MSDAGFDESGNYHIIKSKTQYSRTTVSREEFPSVAKQVVTGAMTQCIFGVAPSLEIVLPVNRVTVEREYWPEKSRCQVGLLLVEFGLFGHDD